MSALDQLVQLVPLAAKKAPANKASNVLLVPATVPATVKHGALVHKDAGPARGSPLPARVVAVLGPGATFQRLAATLLPVYAGATGAKPLTADELAKGLVVYNRALLPAGIWTNHQVGLCLPLPIEIDAVGAWTLNADEVRGWAGSFVPAWRRRLSTPPAPLAVLEPAQIEVEAAIVLISLLRGMPLGQLWERALQNPSEAVLRFIAIVRQLMDGGPTGPKLALAFALAFLDGVQAHHVALLAATTAGNGILRRVAKVLEPAPPPGTDMAKLVAARALVDNALFQGPPGARTLRPHREVPETADLLAPRPGSAKAVPGAKADPIGGLHRVVLGRDVGVGRSDPARVGGLTFTGPAFGGRLLLDPFLDDDARGLRAADPAVAGPLALLALPDAKIGRLDAVTARDAGLLSVGLGAWTALDPAGLPALLFKFKRDSADEFDLFFGLHGLHVDQDPADATKFRLRKVGADGKPSTVMDAATLRTFLGGTVAASGAVTFSSDWAARFRLPALVSRRYRRAQVVLAMEKVKRTANPVELAVASVSPFPKPYTLAVDGPRSTALKTAVDVDMDVDGFLAGLPASVPSKGFLSGALIDLTAGVGGLAAPTAYASSRASDDEDTFNIASMGKMLAMYAAFELRFRLRMALTAAEAKGLDVTVANWEKRFQKLVERTWSGRVAKGFPGLDTRMPARFPKLGTMFTFTTVPAPPPPDRRIGQIDFREGTATDIEIIDLDTDPPDLSKMKFLELLKSMIFQSNAFAAGLVIDAVGYPYLNGALREGGFFDPASKKGLWVSGNYRGRDWKRDAVMDLSARGTAHYKAKTNFMGNARQLARLLALTDRGELFDGADKDACKEMRLMMRRHFIFGLPDPDVSFILNDIEATPLVVDQAFSKIGIGVAAPSSTHKGAHDAAIIQRKKGATTLRLRYVVVVIGGYGSVDTGDVGAARRFTQLLDGAIAFVHSPPPPPP